jgi:RNA polymerase sigma-70 factor (ECF subfamily)
MVHPDSRHAHLRDRLPDESALIMRAQLDPRDFAPLYDHYVDAIYRYCARRVGDAEAAADMTSLIFSRALAALPTYRGSGSFRSWLFAIAHNAVVDGQRTANDWTSLEEDAEQIDPAPTPEEIVLNQDEAREIRAVLSQLAPDQRQVVELRLAGLTHAEMATILNRSVPAIKMLQGRALMRLRVLLGTTHEAPVVKTGSRR